MEAASVLPPAAAHKNHKAEQAPHWKMLFMFVAASGAMLSFFGYTIMGRMMTMTEEQTKFERENRTLMTAALSLLADSAADAARATEATQASVKESAQFQRATLQVLQEQTATLKQMMHDQRTGAWLERDQYKKKPDE